MRFKAAAIATAIFIGAVAAVCLCALLVYAIAQVFGPLTLVIVPCIGFVGFLWYGMYRSVLRTLKEGS